MYINLFIIISSLLFISYGNAAEPRRISAEEYISQQPSTERKAIVDFLQHQFDHQRESVISQEKLNSCWQNQESFVDRMRFQIINQKLYAEIDNRSYIQTAYFSQIVTFLQNVLKNYYIDDVDFILLHQERMTEISDCPHFLMSKRDSIYERDKFLLPDFYIIDSWQDLINKINNASILNPWDNKEEIIFWRGLTTGDITSLPYSPRYNMTSFDKLPRLSIVMLSKLYPHLINAKFSYYIGNLDHYDHKEFKIILDDLDLISYNYISEADHLKYKYLASIDGNTCAWKRVPWIMASNSALIKQETDTMQWFYPAIKRYVHYVPMKENLSDIFQQLEWMKNNDSKVKQISLNAQNFIRNDLMPENIEAHTAIILNEYHKLHQGVTITPSLPTAEVSLEIAHKKIALEKELKKGKFVQYRNKVRKKIKNFLNDIIMIKDNFLKHFSKP